MNSALRRLVSGQMPAMTGMRKPSIRLQKLFQQAQIEDRLGDGVFRARFNLVGEAAQFVLDVGHAGIGSNADGEVGAGANRVRSDVQAVIQPPHDVDQSDGIHVKHCSRVRIIAQLGRIAGEAENVVQPDRRSAQQIRLDAERMLRSRQV